MKNENKPDPEKKKGEDFQIAMQMPGRPARIMRDLLGKNALSTAWAVRATCKKEASQNCDPLFNLTQDEWSLLSISVTDQSICRIAAQHINIGNGLAHITSVLDKLHKLDKLFALKHTSSCKIYQQVLKQCSTSKSLLFLDGLIGMIVGTCSEGLNPVAAPFIFACMAGTTWLREKGYIMQSCFNDFTVMTLSAIAALFIASYMGDTFRDTVSHQDDDLSDYKLKTAEGRQVIFNTIVVPYTICTAIFSVYLSYYYINEIQNTTASDINHTKEDAIRTLRCIRRPLSTGALPGHALQGYLVDLVRGTQETIPSQNRSADLITLFYLLNPREIQSNNTPLTSDRLRLHLLIMIFKNRDHAELLVPIDNMLLMTQLLFGNTSPALTDDGSSLLRDISNLSGIILQVMASRSRRIPSTTTVSSLDERLLTPADHESIDIESGYRPQLCNSR